MSARIIAPRASAVSNLRLRECLAGHRIVDSENQRAECGKYEWDNTTMKKTYSSAFKSKLVLELLKGDKSLTQLACEHKVYPNLLRNLRSLALADFVSLF